AVPPRVDRDRARPATAGTVPRPHRRPATDPAPGPSGPRQPAEVVPTSARGASPVAGPGAQGAVPARRRGRTRPVRPAAPRVLAGQQPGGGRPVEVLLPGRRRWAVCGDCPV